MFSGQIGSLSREHRTQLPARLEAGRWRSTRLRDPPITTQSEQHSTDIIQCGCASFRRHDLDFLPKLPSVTAFSDDIAFTEGGR
jgi:hypothetical protein